MINSSEDGLWSYEDESSSHGDIEIVEIVTHLRSSEFVELDFERRPANAEEVEKFEKKNATNKSPTETIGECKNWTNNFTLGPTITRAMAMTSAQTQIGSTQKLSAKELSESDKSERRIWSFEDEVTSKGENTIVEFVTRVRADDHFEIANERRPPTAQEREKFCNAKAKPKNRASKTWQNSIAFGENVARSVEVHRTGGGDLAIGALSPCSAVDYATILKDLNEDHETSELLEELPQNRSRFSREDKAQSRDMAMILLSRYNPQSLIQLNKPRRKGTPTHP